MSPAVVALGLFAAVLHASWNALLRSGSDRLWTITVMSLTMAVVAVPFLFVFPVPPAGAWPLLAASALVQVGYSVFLVAAYAHGDLGQVYPVVRGSVPILVTVGGFAFLGERLDGRSVTGVALIALGIMGLTLGKGRASARSLGYAFAAGVTIAVYNTLDALGVRTAGNAGSYTAWVFLLWGAAMTVTYTAMRGRLRFDVRVPASRRAVAGGFVSLLAYAAVIGGFALGPAGPVTALRETSVVVALVIGRFLLGETLTRTRILACTVVAAGAMVLVL